jgi:hypothetical protein
MKSQYVCSFKTFSTQVPCLRIRQDLTPILTLAGCGGKSVVVDSVLFEQMLFHLGDCGFEIKFLKISHNCLS